jgi:peptidoglycan hydrolase-like protein with peptidoglycan-binding domain
MSAQRSKRTVSIALGLAVALALLAWLVGQGIRSPAQIAAETAAPNPSAITVPVEKRVLSSEVIVRGTVRYGSPQPVVLANSTVKNSSANQSSIVTTRPRRGSRFGEGTVVMSVSGRPVFVLRGAMASHRDMGPGDRGPDVRQLESALARMGFSPGAIDGRYDGATANAVAAWYEKGGWEPFGPTDAQLDQLRAARATAAAARDSYLRSKVDIKTAREKATPAEIEQARIDVETARDAIDTAVRELASQRGAESLALANARRDDALAAADVATKRAALNKARDALAEAQRSLAQASGDVTPAERATLETAVRQANDDVSVAQADLTAAIASQTATRAGGRDAVRKARADARRAQVGLPRARRQLVLSQRRLRILTAPQDTTLQQLVSEAAAKEARETAADAARLARKLGIYVPADEVLFFPTLPLRVDSVRVRRGDTVNGRVMTVSNSRLAVDSSLSLNDAKLVRPGALVKIEEPDLGIKTTGKVTAVASSPGTHKVDPGRVYLQVTPGTAPAQLVGASVKLTVAVKSTRKAVLVVPVTALSVGADGSSRVQVQRPGGRAEYVTVVPGLAAQGLVEIRAARGLDVGDLVIVGERGEVVGGSGQSNPLGATGTTGGIEQPPGSGSKGSGSGATDGTTGSGGGSKSSTPSSRQSPSRGGPTGGTTP